MLKITEINLRNFRSYEQFELEGIGDLTILVGPNASGKTNAVEAVQLLTALSSFRGATAAELLRQGESAGRIEAKVSDGNRQLDIVMTMSMQDASAALPVEGAFAGSAGSDALPEEGAFAGSAGSDALPEEGAKVRASRHYTLNGKAKQTRDLRGTLPSVTFTPDDLELVKGSDRHRRRELDMLGAQLNANYHQLIRDYDKVLRQKNRLLKDEAPIALVEATDEVFAKVAAQLTKYRISLFDRLVPHIAEHYRGISESAGEELTAHYRSEDGPLGEGKTRESLLREELSRHRTLAGPHLDKVHFYIDGLDARSFASQGQQRSIVLALKLAEAEVIEEILGQLPILLLDDVMSELDGARREALVHGLLEGKQTFVTTANIDYFDKDMLAKAQVVELGLR